MTLDITFSSTALPSKGTVALIIAGDKLGAAGTTLDKTLGGAISRGLKAQGFQGKAGETFSLFGPSAEIDRVVVVSTGKPDKVDDLALINAGGFLAATLVKGKAASVSVAVDASPKKSKSHPAALAGHGALLRAYRFDKYRTTIKPEDKPKLADLNFHCKDAAAAKKAYAPLAALSDGVIFTRDIVSEPPNVLHPVSYADKLKELSKIGLKVTVLDLAALKKLKMGALIGVAQGSVIEPRVVVMEWNGGKKGDAPLALLGKGVTFDTGGISIKPAGNMDEMKWDMAGSGAVVGTMIALAKRKAKANIVGIVGLVENMPDGNAQRPGDVVTSMSGQTIEVLNTDAEGRLVLCDVLTYAQRTYKPKAMVDLATLTGAVIVALGHEQAAVLSNNDKLTKQLIDSGDATGEKLWRLPLGEAYHRDIDSPIADMKNIGSAREAGTIIGGVFLERFVENNTPWAHLDIAAMAWAYKDQPACPKGATAYGVRLLDRMVADHFEK